MIGDQTSNDAGAWLGGGSPVLSEAWNIFCEQGEGSTGGYEAKPAAMLSESYLAQPNSGGRTSVC